MGVSHSVVYFGLHAEILQNHMKKIWRVILFFRFKAHFVCVSITTVKRSLLSFTPAFFQFRKAPCPLICGVSKEGTTERRIRRTYCLLFVLSQGSWFITVMDRVSDRRRISFKTTIVVHTWRGARGIIRPSSPSPFEKKSKQGNDIDGVKKSKKNENDQKKKEEKTKKKGEGQYSRQVGRAFLEIYDTSLEGSQPKTWMTLSSFLSPDDVSVCRAWARPFVS